MSFSAPPVFPCRNIFFCAATDEMRLRQAVSRDIDILIVDLEDEIRAGDKASAREAMLRTFADLRTDKKIFVRTNGVGTEWIVSDLKAIAKMGQIDGVVIPKVESRSDLMTASVLLEEADLSRLPLIAVIESPVAILAISEIADAPVNLVAFTMGPFDMSRAIGCRRDDDAGPVLIARAMALMAARVRGIAALDGPAAGTLAAEEKRAAFKRSREMGFDGKIFTKFEDGDEIRSIFTPHRDQLALAQEIVDAFAGQSEPFTVTLAGGATVDRRNLVWAERVLLNCSGVH